MEERQVKVGDVVAWADVPSGALVRGSWGGRDYFIERHRWRYWVKNENNAWWAAEKVAPALRAANLDTLVTIVALDVPADATAADLQRLAKVFEVREAVSSLISADGPWLLDDAPPAIVLYLSRGQQLTVVELDADGVTTSHALDAAAKKLHRAGWRPGMTAEDAARMLADLAPGCPDGLGCELCFDQDDPA